ncbi:MAG: NAD(P)/FAD-dependent oxidoreductase [Clostridiales bacterium]|nr:NAD(P)/FAD-dependent oxidoreductase [Clostridiales bacterium]
MPTVVIIGKGPAGISAALYTSRANVNTIVIGKDEGALARASKIENYYGFEKPIDGRQLVRQGIAQAINTGAQVIDDEVVGIAYDEKFVVKTKDGQYESDAVLIATGTSRTTPRIKGIRELEGIGISYCAICDAFFYRGKNVAVMGNGEYAVHEALELKPIVGSVTILTDGKPMEAEVPEGVEVVDKEIEAFEGNDVLEGVLFKDGTRIPFSGVFIAIGVAGSTDLARKVGAIIDGNRIVVDENMATSIPGLYAAGDCTGGLLQIAKAVYEGAKAGTEIVKFLRSK